MSTCNAVIKPNVLASNRRFPKSVVRPRIHFVYGAVGLKEESRSHSYRKIIS